MVQATTADSNMTAISVVEDRGGEKGRGREEPQIISDDDCKTAECIAYYTTNRKKEDL